MRMSVANHVVRMVLIVAATIAGGELERTLAGESLVIAVSPSTAVPLKAIGRAFETVRPDVTVQLYVDSSLDIRRTIAAMENHARGRYFIGTGPIHIVAPGGDELLTRLAQKYYVLAETRRSYAAVPLVLVVPESLVEAPASFAELAQWPNARVAIADPVRTMLGQSTMQLLQAVGIVESLEERIDVGHDTRGVLDHVLSGRADAGIIFGPDAVQEKERIRVVAVADPAIVQPVVHSMAMERYCPNRRLCDEFLAFSQSAEAQALLVQLGYLVPGEW